MHTERAQLWWAGGTTNTRRRRLAQRLNAHTQLTRRLPLEQLIESLGRLIMIARCLALALASRADLPSSARHLLIGPSLAGGKLMPPEPAASAFGCPPRLRRKQPDWLRVSQRVVRAPLARRRCRCRCETHEPRDSQNENLLVPHVGLPAAW